MKIAQIVPSLANAGPVIVSHRLTDVLNSLGHNVDIYYFYDIQELDFGKQVYLINEAQPIDFDSYDIIHSHGLLPDKYVHKFRHHIKRAKTVTTIHQNIYEDLKLCLGRVKSLLITPYWLHVMSSKNAIVPISYYIFSIYDKWLKRLSSPVYNGATIYYEPENQIVEYADLIKSLKQRTKITIGTYAALTRIKRIDQLIYLAKRREEIGVVIIGEGEEEKKLKEIASDISDRVLFIPKVFAPYNYLESIDAYVMSSSSEGFCLAMTEAVISQTPVICSRIPVMTELYDNDEVTFFELDNLDSLSDAVNVAISTKRIKPINAYKRYLENYTNEKMCEGYLRIYNALITGGSKTPII